MSSCAPPGAHREAPTTSAGEEGPESGTLASQRRTEQTKPPRRSPISPFSCHMTDEHTHARAPGTSRRMPPLCSHPGGLRPSERTVRPRHSTGLRARTRGGAARAAPPSSTGTEAPGQGVPVTVRHGLPATGHDAVAELDDLGDADDLLGVVAFVGQQHQEEEDVRDDGLGLPGDRNAR